MEYNTKKIKIRRPDKRQLLERSTQISSRLTKKRESCKIYKGEIQVIFHKTMDLQHNLLLLFLLLLLLLLLLILFTELGIVCPFRNTKNVYLMSYSSMFLLLTKSAAWFFHNFIGSSSSPPPPTVRGPLLDFKRPMNIISS